MPHWSERRDLDVQPHTAADVEAQDVGRHLVVLADLADGALHDALGPVLDDLRAFDCLAVVPERYLHVTVTIVGNVGPRQRLAAADERRIAADLDAVLDGTPAFDVEFPQFDLFPTVVFAAVHDGGAFADCNDRACSVDGVEVHDRDRGFVPHATLAQFTGTSDYDDLVTWLEANRSLDLPGVRVEELELVAADLGERFPSFETVATYPLDG